MSPGPGPALLANLDAEISSDGAGWSIRWVRGPDERPGDAHHVQPLPHLGTGRGSGQRAARRGSAAPGPALTMATTGPAPMSWTRRPKKGRSRSSA